MPPLKAWVWIGLAPKPMSSLGREQDVKRVYYMSMEFLMGRSLLNALYNLQISGQYSQVRQQQAQAHPISAK